MIHVRSFAFEQGMHVFKFNKSFLTKIHDLQSEIFMANLTEVYLFHDHWLQLLISILSLDIGSTRFPGMTKKPILKKKVVLRIHTSKKKIIAGKPICSVLDVVPKALL